MNQFGVLGLLLPLSLALAPAAARVALRPALTLEGAKQVAAAAAAKARESGEGGAIAVVDAGGSLIYLERLPGTFAAAAQVATGKARTAALFRMPTRTFEEVIRKGRTPMVALKGFTPLTGGVPLSIAGRVVGAVGVSGAASAARDEVLALAGAKAIRESTAPRAVLFFERGRVDAGFAKGKVLFDGHDGRNFMIHASRRDGPGGAEVHAHDTDIMYVLSGSATVVTGGTVEEARSTGPGEVRGRSIRDGQARQVVPGDVLVVPRGVPHWFREVRGPMTYYVVKVRGGGAR